MVNYNHQNQITQQNQSNNLNNLFYQVKPLQMSDSRYQDDLTNSRVCSFRKDKPDTQSVKFEHI